MRREISVYTKKISAYAKKDFCIYGNFLPHILKEIAVYTRILLLPF